MTLRRLPMCGELINKHYSDYTLLDIGCRTMALKKHLKSCREYFGADLVPGENILECNLEQGLIHFEDKSFDIVVALDVLEHLENAHHALHEMIRVARRAVFVSLPNMYYIKFRLNFLFGKGLSGKYAFPVDPVLDRHRWVMSYSEAVNFICKNAAGFPVEIRMILPERGRTKAVSEPVEFWLGKTWPDLFAYGSLFMIRLDGIQDSYE